jgi:hypothetical protein
MRATFLAVLALLFTGLAGAVDDTYNDWFKHFYQTQDVGQFDGYWKMVVSNGVLENRNTIPPTLGFASQVLHQHPALIKGRLDDPSAFPRRQREPVLALLWLSDTKEARQILEKAGNGKLLEKSPPAIGGWEIKTGGDLDFCWGWYFATGDTAALDPIISALDFGRYAGARKRYQTSQKTEEDRRAAVKDAIFGAAMWSLGANGTEDRRVARHLTGLFFDPQTPPSRKAWLAVILAKVSPDRSPQELEDNPSGPP